MSMVRNEDDGSGACRSSAPVPSLGSIAASRGTHRARHAPELPGVHGESRGTRRPCHRWNNDQGAAGRISSAARVATA
jgi:hypothetical protein